MRAHIGQYRIEAALGRGGMGVVHRGVHEHLGREVAIKALAPELTQQPEFKERFFSEAKTQARLQHPNIVGVYDLLAEAGEYFIVMELVSGVGLDDRMRDLAGRMDLGEALEVFGQMLAALDYAHSEGVIHRDIKPSNVLITPSGRVKLTDFGIALLVGDKRLTASQSAIGTPTYMSPEQILRPRSVDHRTDIYSAAVVFFEMLAGRPPFDGETEYGIKKLHVEAAPPDLAVLREGLPAGISAAVDTALSKNPEERFPSAGAFLRALHAAVPAQGLPAALTPPPQPVFRPTVAEPVDRPDPSPPPAARPVVSPAGGLSAGKRRRHLLGTAALLAALLGLGRFLLLLQLVRGSEPVVAEAGSASPLDAAAPVPSLQPPPAPAGPASEALPLASPPAAQPPPAAPAPTRAREAPRSRKKPETTSAPPAPAPLPPEPAAVPDAEPAVAEPEPAERDAVLERFKEMDAVIVRLEDLSKKALKSYERADLDTALGPKLASFRDGAVALRKEFRTVSGTGVFSALRRRGREAGTRNLESTARDLLRRSGDVEGLIAGDSGGPKIEGPWREIRRELQRLETFFP
jgi:predicted Ser/Thr protein kinase